MSKHKIIVTAILAASIFFAVASIRAADDIEEHRSCIQCGMDRKAYGYSRMLIQFEDGAAVGVCSLHCAVKQLDLHIGRAVKSIQAADRDTRSLIDAAQAFWVMGGGKRGVMTQVPKWAFGTKAGAEAFIKANGGSLVFWEEARRAASQQLHKGH
jgi:hypothetical protein